MRINLNVKVDHLALKHIMNSKTKPETVRITGY